MRTYVLDKEEEVGTNRGYAGGFFLSSRGPRRMSLADYHAGRMGRGG